MSSFRDWQEKQSHRVALVRCEGYDLRLLAAAVQRGLDCLGGVKKFCSPGEVLLLKPNLLLGDRPERASTTHPAVFRAVAGVSQGAGCRLVYGDSPGFGSPRTAVCASGFHEVAEDLGLTLADFITGYETSYPDGRLMKQFRLAQGVLDAGGVINLPKFKTHGLMRLTGAVKNLFGCLPGVQKAGFHARLQDEARFGQMLVDLAGLISPRVHIMDGVVGMEGNGPRNGQPRKLGVLLFSTNPHALDYVAAGIMNLEPDLVPTLDAARRWGLFAPEAIQTCGDPLEAFICRDFKVNRSRMSTTGNGGLWQLLFKRWITPRPVIDAQRCTSCGRCVQVCPAEPRAVGFTNGRDMSPQYDYDSCIRCYCCQEMCPDEAISIRTSYLGRLVRRIRG